MTRKVSSGGAHRGRGLAAMFPRDSGEVKGSSATDVEKRRLGSGGVLCAVWSGEEKGVGEKKQTTMVLGAF
jgi:hypothetical protein